MRPPFQPSWEKIVRVSLFRFSLGLLLAGAALAADSLHVRVIGHYTSPIYLNPSEPGNVAVDVDDNYAYFVGFGAFLVVSVADPARAALVGSCDWDTTLGRVEAAGNFAYVADAHGRQLRVVSVADPAHPVEVARCSVNQALDVALSGSYAYVACDSYGLHVVSVADPTNPREIGYCETPGLASDVKVDGAYAYVADGAGGLRIISVADPEHPVEVGHYIPEGTNVVTVAVSQDYAYLGCFWDRSFRVVSIADPAHPAEVGRLDSLGYFVGDAGFNGNYAFAATAYADAGALRVFSIAEPAHPAEVGYYTLGACLSADTGRGYVYVGSYDGTYQDSYAGLWILQFYIPGDLDVDNDSLDVVADAIRLRGSDSYARGEFVLANTSAAYNPDTADGPSLSVLDSVHFTGSLLGPGGTLDSILIPNLPAFLAEGQVVVCSLAVFTPPGLRDGDYTGSITISGKDTAGFVIADTFYARLTKLGDLDVDGDSLDLVRDTTDLHTQPAGPVYSPYAKAEFMLVNTNSLYNPDTEDGPCQSTLREVKVEAKVEGQNGAIDSVYVLNLPESLAVGQAVECTLALVLPVGRPDSSYNGVVTISALDTAGYEVRDSFFLAVSGPQPRENLDSLRVAPIPFKPNQNPEHDAIHFQGLTGGARVTVYDASGQSVWSETELGDGHLKWEAKVASGIYVYLVVSKDGESCVGKLSVIR